MLRRPFGGLRVLYPQVYSGSLSAPPLRSLPGWDSRTFVPIKFAPVFCACLLSWTGVANSSYADDALQAASAEQTAPSFSTDDIPTSTQGWLDVFKARQKGFTSIELTSHWKSYKDDALQEEWDQVCYTDDLGRQSLEEFGRLERSDQNKSLGALRDVICAYDGSEYRECNTRWRVALGQHGDFGDLNRLRLAPPTAVQAWIHAAPEERSELKSATTPFSMLESAMMHCFIEANTNSIEPTLSGGPMNHLWLLNIAIPSIGAYDALVDTNQGSRFVSLTIQHKYGAVTKMEVAYANMERGWVPASGKRYYRGVDKDGRPSKAWASEFQVTNVKRGELREMSGFLPSFPKGAYVVDFRTDARYRVRMDGEVEKQMGFLVAEAKNQLTLTQSPWRGPVKLLKQAITCVFAACCGCAIGLSAQFAFVLPRRLWSKSNRRTNGNVIVAFKAADSLSPYRAE